MNAQPTRLVRVRRANKVTAVGKHYTLTSVVNSRQKAFAFAVSDDGEEEIYIPAPVVKREQMTEADIGAGFTCTVRKPEGFDRDAPHPHARLPIWWDGAAENLPADQVPGMEVADDDEPDPEVKKLEADIDDLGNAVDKLVQYEGALIAMQDSVAEMSLALRRQQDELGKIIAEVKTVRTILDRVCPNLEE
jgi:hypothetical protein